MLLNSNPEISIYKKDLKRPHAQILRATWEATI